MTNLSTEKFPQKKNTTQLALTQFIWEKQLTCDNSNVKKKLIQLKTIELFSCKKRLKKKWSKFSSTDAVKDAVWPSGDQRNTERNFTTRKKWREKKNINETTTTTMTTNSQRTTIDHRVVCSPLAHTNTNSIQRQTKTEWNSVWNKQIVKTTMTTVAEALATTKPTKSTVCTTTNAR